MINVRNLQRRQRINLAALQSFAERALLLCTRLRRAIPTPLTTLSEINVLLISNRRMAVLHQRFMGVPGPTDVLTFEHGEIFISVETARANGPRFQTTTEAEVQLYLVHGLLHLHGYDDVAPAQAKRMHAVQDRICAAARGAAV